MSRRVLASAVAVLALLLAPALAPPASAANDGAHVGLAAATLNDRWFAAGALLADIDHFLPPGEPQTDTPAFAHGMLVRSWDGSRAAWSVVRGWVEHLDQDARFDDALVAIARAFPSYTVVQVRLAFDYWTVAKHPFSTDFAFLLADPEIPGLIAGGLVATDAAGVRAAMNSLLYSTDVNAPGLLLQVNASRLFGALYPQVVADLQPYYDAFFAAATAGWRDPFPKVDAILSSLTGLVRRMPAGLRAPLAPLVDDARYLDYARPAGWTAPEVAVLLEIARIAGAASGPTVGGRLAAIAAELADSLATALASPP